MDLQAIKRRYNIIGNSEKLNHALATAVRVANTDLTVLIQGESGVGKEVFSKLIHQLSSRKHNDFIALNCAAIPAGTINSELFGHEKGAFTGASSERKGYFETVNGGTIFLDEVGEMPLDTQAFLLRVLENGEFLRVGSSKVRKTDVRVIAATNVDLKIKVKERKFREDLYYRLSTVPIYIPPLRERPEDILILFKKFARDVGEKYNSPTIKLDEEAKILILNYSWPGNIRELKNVVEKLSILSDDRIVTAEKLIYIVPEITSRNLPVSIGNFENEKINDRDLIYKFLLDMKNDIAELKAMLYNIVRANDLLIPAENSSYYADQDHGVAMMDLENKIKKIEDNIAVTIPKERAVVVTPKQEEKYEYEIMDENLNLEEVEKNVISKALKKDNGKRRKAAQELGVSERTLYRKINEYKIDL